MTLGNPSLIVGFNMHCYMRIAMLFIIEKLTTKD